MKRHVLGLALAFLPACITENPVAEELPDQKTAEEQLRDEIGPMCDRGCAKNEQCGYDSANDCPAHCRDYMAAFVGHGAECVALGQGIVDCTAKLETCDDYAHAEDCDVPGNERELCAAGETVLPPVYCDGGGSTSGGVAPGADGSPAQTTSCDVYYGECSDHAEYRVSCHPIEGTMVCSCFRNGVVSGSAFTPIEDSCPTFDEINEPCDWNIVG